MKKVILATNNLEKINELYELLKECKFNILFNHDFSIRSIKETKLTFIENAILKARHVAKLTGLSVISDDSGISVNALNGSPGVNSKRFAGKNSSDTENIKKLLYKMKDIPYNKRQAQFNCVLVYLRNFNDPIPIICHGIWKGIITDTPKGINGFGYDSIFYDEKLKMTAAQLTKYQKNHVSHRFQASKLLLEYLKND